MRERREQSPAPAALPTTKYHLCFTLRHSGGDVERDIPAKNVRYSPAFVNLRSIGVLRNTSAFNTYVLGIMSLVLICNVYYAY